MLRRRRARNFEGLSPDEFFALANPNICAGDFRSVGELNWYEFSEVKLLSVTFSSDLKDDIGRRRYWLRALSEGAQQKNENHSGRYEEFLHSQNPRVLPQNQTQAVYHPAPSRAEVISYRNSSMHCSSTSLPGRTTDSGNVASGWSVRFNMSRKVGAWGLM
jgi:hypothetical protein